jgi:D-sedoheptulose 7-phosphate isomerase
MKKSKFLYILEYKKSLLEKFSLQEKKINEVSKIIFKSLNRGNKILLCGNGGSASDAQHLAAEFLVRLRPKINRRPIPAITLAQDTSTITACANDYSFNDLFSRNLEALGKKGDILIIISTSGNSKNIINVLKTSKKKKIISIGFLGKNGGKAKRFCNHYFLVPSNITARVQEMHIFLGHFIFETVEDMILKKK